MFAELSFRINAEMLLVLVFSNEYRRNNKDLGPLSQMSLYRSIGPFLIINNGCIFGFAENVGGQELLSDSRWQVNIIKTPNKYKGSFILYSVFLPQFDQENSN